MGRECIKKYIDDLKHLIANNLIFKNTYDSLSKISNYTKSLPYFSKLFYQPNEYQNLHKKAFYDQKQVKQK